jgi:molybdate transport system substrate-binding protein
MNRFLSVVVAALTMLAIGTVAPAQTADPLTFLCSNGLKAVVEDLVPKFERASTQKVVVKYGLAASLKQRIEGGEPFDLAALTPGAMDDLIAHGTIAASTRATIARSGLAIAIRSGAKKRDIHSVAAFKQALLDAKSIAYAKEGASGIAFRAIIEKLGITGALDAKSKQTATGEEVSESVASGTIDFGILPISEILPVKGAEVMGAFPSEIQSFIVMVAGVKAGAAHAAVAGDLIRFMTSPDVLPVITAKGMQR